MYNMDKKIKYLTIGFFLTIITIHNSLHAQEEVSMYYLNSVPQSIRLNPAVTPDYKGYFGGLVVPILGQILPPLNIDISTNSFTYKDIIQKPGGIYGDSLAWVFRDTTLARQFLDGLDRVVKINFHTYIDLLHFGFKTQNMFWHFSMVEKIEVTSSIPRDLMRLLWYGNAGFPSSTIDLSNLGVSAMHYRELGVGVSHQVNDQLSLGAKAKALFGMSNVDMPKTNIEWYTDPATSEFRFNTDFIINVTQPAADIHDLRYDTEGDSIIFDYTEKSFKPLDYALNFKNLGMAFDLGAVFTPVNKVKIHASITDLGFIRWRDNVTNIHARGKDFSFKGFDFINIMNDSIDDFFDDLLDSLVHSLDPQLKHQAYTTTTPMKIYLGGEYQLTDIISFGVLYKGTKWTDRLSSSFTVSANINKQGFGGVVSYSISKDYLHNVGVGVAFRIGGWQTFIVTDNILAVAPYNVRNFSIRFGSNWIFRQKKKSAQLIAKNCACHWY